MNIAAVTCDSVSFIIRAIKIAITVVRWVIPILLMVLVTFDLVKGMTQKSEDEMKKATSKIVTRVIWAVAIFFVPMIIGFIFKQIGGNVSEGNLEGPASWISCYNSISI